MRNYRKIEKEMNVKKVLDKNNESVVAFWLRVPKVSLIFLFL